MGHKLVGDDRIVNKKILFFYARDSFSMTYCPLCDSIYEACNLRTNMKADTRTKFAISVILILSVAFIIAIHTLIFHDLRTLAFYFLLDLALIPVQVLIVTLLIDQLLKQHEKRAMLGKLNMVIGIFFTETGTRMLQQFMAFDRRGANQCRAMAVAVNWTSRDYENARAQMNNLDLDLVGRADDLAKLRDYLLVKRPFFLSLLENPNLLEHESFTDLLWAVFHLTEELSMRKDLHALTEPDLEHMGGDLKRVYTRLIVEWLAYLKHQKRDYPYLFSLAVRTNPFDKNASVEIRLPA